jgi:hypothetical protein
MNRFHRWSALMTLVALTGCAQSINYTDPSGPRFAGSSNPEPVAAWTGPHVDAAAAMAGAPTPDSLRVVTFNVRYSEQTGLAVKLLQTAPELRGADIVMLQEMNEDAVA